MFHVTYEIHTPESVHDGEPDETGLITVNATLREAIVDVLETRTVHCAGIGVIEPSDTRTGDAQWLTVHNGIEFYTGAHETRSLHFPKHLTPATRARICRLVERGI